MKLFNLKKIWSLLCMLALANTVLSQEKLYLIVDNDVCGVCLNSIDTNCCVQIPNVKEIEIQAKMDDAVAQNILGFCYYFGVGGCKQDYQKAAKNFKKSADQGNSDAQCNLGYIYRYGVGEKKKDGRKAMQNSDKALEYFELSAKQGNLVAIYHCKCVDNWGKTRKLFKSDKNWDNILDTSFFNTLQYAAKQGYITAQIEAANLKYNQFDKYRWLKVIEKRGGKYIHIAKEIKERFLRDIGMDEKDVIEFLINQQKPEKYLEDAKKGNASAQYHLGEVYLAGYGDTLSNFFKAKEWYVKSAKNGNDSAMYALTLLLFNIFQEIEDAESWCLKAVDKGNIDAMMLLGRSGRNKERKEQAITYYTKAANLGYIPAMIELGDFLMYSNANKAMEWYETAAKAGNVDAMMKAAKVWADNNNIVNAQKWYETAAIGGNVTAMLDMAALHTKAKEEKKALYWCNVASSMGNISATEALAKYYNDSDIEKALEYWQRALSFRLGMKENQQILQSANPDFGYSESRLNNTYIFERKKLISSLEKKLQAQREQEAIFIEDLKKSATNNDVIAMLKLGQYYQKKNNTKEANEWFAKAEKMGDAATLFSLGQIYATQQQFDKAIYYYNQALNKGNYEAAAELGLLYYSGFGFKQDKNKAKTYLQQASDKGVWIAQNFLEMIKQEKSLPNRAEEKIEFKKRFPKYQISDNDFQTIDLLRSFAEGRMSGAKYDRDLILNFLKAFPECIESANAIRKIFNVSRDRKDKITLNDLVAIYGKEKVEKGFDKVFDIDYNTYDKYVRYDVYWEYLSTYNNAQKVFNYVDKAIENMQTENEYNYVYKYYLLELSKYTDISALNSKMETIKEYACKDDYRSLDKIIHFNTAQEAIDYTAKMNDGKYDWYVQRTGLNKFIMEGLSQDGSYVKEKEYCDALKNNAAAYVECKRLIEEYPKYKEQLEMAIAKLARQYDNIQNSYTEAWDKVYADRNDRQRREAREMCAKCELNEDKSKLPDPREPSFWNSYSDQSPGKLVMKNGYEQEFYWDKSEQCWYTISGFIFTSKEKYKKLEDLLSEFYQRCKKEHCK